MYQDLFCYFLTLVICLSINWYGSKYYCDSIYLEFSHKGRISQCLYPLTLSKIDFHIEDVCMLNLTPISCSSSIIIIFGIMLIMPKFEL
jgi:hypothetical protein